MMKRVTLYLLIFSTALFSPPDAAHEAAAQTRSRPNIIIIMSDDMGFSDVGSYGGEISTPNLDQLAANGLRFTQFYNTARCSPTRASLLTGLYPHQAGVGHMMENRGHDGYRGDLNRHSVTIAEALKPAGYATYAVGKWHVTPGQTAAKLERTHNWPLQRGFDRFYGTIHGAGSFFDPSSLVRDNKLITAFNDAEYQPPQYYYTDAISDHAARFIAEHKGRGGSGAGDKPFFMYVAYTAAHRPMHALEKDIATYRGKYDGGYAAVRRARYEKAKRLGLIDSRWQMSPPPGDWDGVANREWETRGMEVYAAMIDNMDQGIGRIVAELKRQGQFDNTLIFFLQDNGGCAELVGRATTERHPHKTRPEKAAYAPMTKDEQQFNSIPRQTRAGFPVMMGTGALPGPADTYIAYGKGWANVSNTPFREYKHWTHEGGISTPLIAHWPQGIPVRQRNRLVHSPGHLIDLMRTCVDVSGAQYPREFNGQKIHPMEGISLRPALVSKALWRGQPIFWEHEGNRAVREGKWKLVAKENQPWELYDLAADRTEINNLAAQHPEKVKELSAKWDTWAARANVLPLGQWRAKEL
ncbi:MAG: arylsulfatase [Acidobacteriota bacterium]|nr:arylsulfatase [Acidobacteriota bacterium]